MLSWPNQTAKPPRRQRTNRVDYPGDVLREDFMKPFGLAAYAVVKSIGSTPITISLIVPRKRAVSAEMVMKLGRYFNVSPELWMGIQADYDVELARLRREVAIAKRIQPLAAFLSQFQAGCGA
jgi:addiction module HigA family antidote